jgi:hypothetical protein
VKHSALASFALIVRRHYMALLLSPLLLLAASSTLETLLNTPTRQRDFSWGVVIYSLFVYGVVVAQQIAKANSAKRQAAKGKCRVCGYDLRATPDRCPECGAIPSDRAAQ